MKKATYRQFPVGSAEYVIAHAAHQTSRGRQPSLPYLTDRNPRKALKVARVVSSAKGHTTAHDKHMVAIASHIIGRNIFDEMSDTEFEAVVRAIIVSSSSKEEVKRRLDEELDYPYSIHLNLKLPSNQADREARELVSALGGMVMANGAMAMAMLRGPSGEIIDL